MKIKRNFGNVTITFEGSAEAIGTYIKVHARISESDYFYSLPDIGDSVTLAMPWIGEVEVSRVADRNCIVTQRQGAILSGLKSLFSM